MKSKFQKIDLSAVMFNGLSKPLLRKGALVATALIWLLVVYTLVAVVLVFQDNDVVLTVMLLCASIFLIDYIVNNRFLPSVVSEWLVEYTPLVKLYRKDLAVMDTARKELLNITENERLDSYLKFGKINPLIRSETSLHVMAAQRKGGLSKWVESPEKLKMLADLVYQIHLAEKFLLDDCDRF